MNITRAIYTIGADRNIKVPSGGTRSQEAAVTYLLTDSHPLSDYEWARPVVRILDSANGVSYIDWSQEGLGHNNA
jgi:hypothetical protein